MNDDHQTRAGFWGWLGALWGLGGVFLLLGFALYRLTPLALEGLSMPLSTLQIIFVVVFVVFMLYSEGYRGFQRAFSPRVAARARHLRDHPTPLRVVLAPFFCMAWFDAPRRRRIAAWCLFLGVVLLVIIVQRFEQPWRGLVDAGVVLGLGWGFLATLLYGIRALGPGPFRYAPEVVTDPAPATASPDLA